jgi:hypothetical protein
MESEGLARADVLLRLAQAQGAAPPRYEPASWVSYGDGEAILLTIGLLVVASGFAYAGVDGCASRSGSRGQESLPPDS